jgi:dimethylhistidine N-methyltransferase
MTAPARRDRPESPAAAPDAMAVLRGLSGRPKMLSPALFYDDAGAALFERITTLDAYYLTRAELEILRAHIAEIAQLAGAEAVVIEYGSGAGTKIRLLLSALDRPAAYVPIDISETQLARVAAELSAEHPTVMVQPVHADYSAPFRLPELPAGSRRVGFFPGSTIGNFTPAEAADFLRGVRHTLGPDGALILGVDRRKEPDVLLAAYDDPEGVTAEFNLNVLTRLNRELGAEFDLARFLHRAVWNDAEGRIEMHLESVDAQVVRVAGTPIAFARGETIWTESSYKYDGAQLERLVEESGFNMTRLWTDARERFWVGFLQG